MESSKSLANLMGPMATASGVCDVHGPWSREVPEFLVSRTKCPACATEKAEAAKAAEEKRIAEASAQRRIRNLELRGIGLRHIDKTFATFIADTEEQRKALEVCRSVAEAVCEGQKRIPSLILSGAPGTGKTHLTCAMVQHCYDAGMDAGKRNIIDIIREIKATWRKDSERNEDEVIERYASADLMVIDEIGVQFGTDTERMYVFDIINRRYEQCLPTVLITNLDVNGLREEIGERVLDRLREDGGRLLTFTGKSWRSQ